MFLGGILVLFIYVTRLASNEIFSLSTKLIIVIALIIHLQEEDYKKTQGNKRKLQNIENGKLLKVTNFIYQPK